MSRKALLGAFILVFCGSTLRAATPITIGESVKLPSKVMGEERTVFVSLPESYARTTGKYPVLYLTDAEWHFAHTRSTAAFLARNGLIPEIMIVAVTNPDRTRDLYASRADFVEGGRTIRFPTSGSADRFLEFFEKELIPWTEATYRTAPLRIFAGHSAGGNFALHAMRVKPALFQAVIAVSPWLEWDDRKELKQLVPFLASGDVRARTLFFTSADEGPGMKADIDAVTVALRSRKDASLRWGSATYPNESHDSAVLKSTYDALRMIFDGWSFPRDPRSRSLKGSLDDVKAHYAKLGERLGFPLLPPEATVNALGYQYLQMEDFDASIEAFRYNAEMHPESANVWDSLGDALDRAGKKDEALVSYRKAVSLAEADGDPSLEAFKKKVARLSGAAKPDAK